MRPDARSSAGAAESRSRRFRRLRQVLLAAFVVAVLALAWRALRGIDVDAVLDAVREYRWPTLAIAGALGATSYALIGTFELFGRALVGHDLPPVRTWTIGAVAYAFNLNVGALIGGMGMRLRLYTRHGLETSTVAKLIAVSVSTNWFGYLALAGTAFASGAIEPPVSWRVTGGMLQAIGFAMLAAFVAVLLACARFGGRTVTVRGRDLTVPPLRMALLQALVSAANWLTMAALVWVLLGMRIALPTVAAVLLVAAVAGVITHVPAGLGVLETVFVVLLSEQMPAHELLAALLAYRALYYLAPLVIAAVAWPMLESGRARSARPPDRARPVPSQAD